MAGDAMPDGLASDGAHREAHGDRPTAGSRTEKTGRNPTNQRPNVISRTPTDVDEDPTPGFRKSGSHARHTSREARTGRLTPTQAPVGNGGPISGPPLSFQAGEFESNGGLTVYKPGHCAEHPRTCPIVG